MKKDEHPMNAQSWAFFIVSIIIIIILEIITISK